MRFLIVDDDPEYRQLLRYHLEVEWPDATIEEHQPTSTQSLPQGLSVADLDLLLLGHPVSREEGFTLLKSLRARPRCPPIFVFASPSDEFVAVDALKAGAASYFPKDKVRHHRLVDAIRAEMRTESPGEDTGERIAFKVLRHVPDSGGSRTFDRFLQEYEVIARVRHPNVVKIFDLGVADDHAYIAMEFLGAGSLAERLSAALDPSSAVHYATQIGGALAAIHDAGILHRDLKPANIMFREDGTLALIDFGLAKQMRLHAAITGTGQIFGTPYYMSPEQGHAEPTDPRSDIYSMGCMLHEMLTGERPFTASSPMGVIYRHAHAPRPRLPRSLTHLQPVLDRMLAVERLARYQSARELLADLANATG